MGRAKALLFLLLSACARPPAILPTGPSVSEADLRAHVSYLADPYLEGREPGTAGIELAADYIGRRFEEAGLERPPGAGGGGPSYFQGFDIVAGARWAKGNRMTAAVERPETSLWVEGEPGHRVVPGEKTTFALAPRRDFVPLGFSSDGGGRGAVLFAGYSISDPARNYDDYAEVDAKGKWVLALTHEPQENDPHSVFAGTNHTLHAGAAAKAANAKAHGAAGLLLVRDPLNHGSAPDDLPPLRAEEGGDAGIPVVWITREAAARMAGGGFLETAQRAIDTNLKPFSRDLSGVEADITVALLRERRTTWNVAGILRGEDPKLRDEWVVVGAHYDHLGRGGAHSLDPGGEGRVHPGADDNGSGVAAVLELAQEFAARRERPRRSLLFICFSAEERGLLGSAHYARSPLVPLDRTVAMVNFDMVGRLRQSLILNGVDTSPSWPALLEKANRELRLPLALKGEDLPWASDHKSFYDVKIPVLHFFTGSHEDYHRPTDTAEKIDAAGGARVAAFASRLIEEVANAGERPGFSAVKAAAGTGVGGFRVYFGSMPDYGFEGPGVRLQGVRPESPAAEAGLRAGDVLLRFGGRAIGNVMDLTLALGAHRPGEEVEVEFLRDGKPGKGRAKLRERK